MRSFKEYLAESQEVPARQVSDKELVEILGKGKVKSLLANPFFRDYSSYQKAYKYGVGPAGFPYVEAYFYFDHIHKTPEGKIRPEIMVKFVFAHSGWKIINAHKHTRAKVPGERELKWGSSAGWEHLSDWKRVE
jgi:hypothetical protein